MIKQSDEIRYHLNQHYRKNRKKLLGLTVNKVGNIDEAEDILHDVYVSVLRTMVTNGHIPENLNAWIYVSLKNRIVDFYRSKRRSTETFSSMYVSGVSEETDPMNFEDFISDTTFMPDRMLEQDNIMVTIFDLLMRLPAEQRIVFEQNEFEGISFREMAENTGINMNTLLARKRYAVLFLRRGLREKFGDDYDFMIRE